MNTDIYILFQEHKCATRYLLFSKTKVKELKKTMDVEKMSQAEKSYFSQLSFDESLYTGKI